MSKQSGYAPVSVVIPCYRCTDTLARAVASVAAQQDVPAEIILVDDCSADGTRALMLKLAETYAPGWIRTVLNDANIGAGGSRNAGWALATQPYIAFLDSDDAWHPEKIRRQVEFMQTNPNVVLCGHGHRILSTDALPDWSLDDTPSITSFFLVSKGMLLLSNRFVTPSVMVRRDIPQRFEALQRHMEDHMLWLSIVCSGLVAANIPLPLAAIYKRAYGQAGLSAQLWLMERGDLGNYRRLFARGQVNEFQFGALCIFSLLKFMRRMFLYKLLSWGWK